MTALASRSRLASAGLALAIGLVLGWTVAGAGGRSLRANASGDRWGDWIVTTGMIHQETANALKAAVPQDAVYYLNYKTGQLLASVPTPKTTARGTEILGEFAERDLVAD